MSVICEICQQPIESRKKLAVIDPQNNFKFKPAHYLCYLQEHLNRGKHWMTLNSFIANSTMNRVIYPIIWLAAVSILFAVGGFSNIVQILILSAFLAVPTLSAVIAYLEFEHKVPK